MNDTSGSMCKERAWLVWRSTSTFDWRVFVRIVGILTKFRTLNNEVTCLPNYTATHPWRQKSPYSSLWERHILRNNGIVTNLPVIWRHSSYFHSVGTEVLIVYESLRARRRARGGAVGWGSALQDGRLRVRFPMVSLEFFILPAVLGLTQPLT